MTVIFSQKTNLRGWSHSIPRPSTFFFFFKIRWKIFPRRQVAACSSKYRKSLGLTPYSDFSPGFETVIWLKKIKNPNKKPNSYSEIVFTKKSCSNCYLNIFCEKSIEGFLKKSFREKIFNYNWNCYNSNCL